MNRLLGFLKFPFAILGKLLGTFSLSWSPPSWMQLFKNYSPSKLKDLASRFALSVRTSIHKVRSAAESIPARDRIRTSMDKVGVFFKQLFRGPLKRSAVAFAVVLAILIAGIWYAVRQANAIGVTCSEPGLTKLEEVLKPDPIHVKFKRPVARLDLIGKTITQGISISPSIDGEWKWVNDKDLVFVPKSDWAVGLKYTISMDRSLFADYVRLATYSPTFRTPVFKAELANTEFYQDPENPKIKKVIATIKFTHPVDSADFEKRVRLSRADQKGLFGIGSGSYPFTVTYDKYKGEAYIHSKTVEIPDKDTVFSVQIDSGVRSSRGGPETDNKLEARITVPGKYNYLRINSAQPSVVRNEHYEPEQVIVIETTAGVQESEIVRNLAVFVLPKDLPPVQGEEGKKDYQWAEQSDPAKIGPEILKLSTPLKLKPLPRDREYAELHSFKYTAPTGRYLYIKLNKGMKSFGEYVLEKEYDTIVRVPELPQELGIMSEGSILSLRGEKRLTVYARDLEAIRFQLGRVLPEDINHLISQTRGDIKSPHFTNYNFSDENISERFTEVKHLGRADSGKTQYATIDFSRYLKSGSENRGLFFVKVESWDPEKKRSTGKSDKRLILITDLGVLVKDNADGTHDVFVQSIQTGGPVPGARVDVLGKNGVSVFGGLTDADGRARCPKLSDFEHEKTPTVYLVKRGADLSFLPYERSERRLNLSRFDIGGEATSGEPGKLNAYVFSDRGIYRPGDEFHVGVIVKSADWKKQLAGIPLEAAITDARGLEVKKQKISLSASGFEELKYQTEETAPTGNYTASIYIIKDGKRGALLGSVSVRVEEFLPDRLKITSRISQERMDGWVSPSDLSGLVSLMNLYGTPAVNHRVSADITLSPGFPVFKQYQDYSFFDPLKSEKSASDQLQDMVTNERGEAEFEFNLGRFEKATYRLVFTAEGYELEGGRSVSSTSSVLVSPLSFLIGYKPDGDLKYINKSSSRSIHLIAIDPKLKKTSISGLKAQIIEERYISALTKQSSGVYKYQSIKKEIPVSTAGLTIPQAGLQFRLPTGNPGDFVLIVKDEKNVELSRVAFSVAGKGNLTRSLEKNAELQIKLNKADYAPGEEIELNIRAPYTGAGLITIERDRVYAAKWFKTGATNSVQKIRVPANFEGNGYVNVSFVRALDSREIFMSPLSYGVMPFSVSRDKRMVKIDIDTPDLARPGELLRIRYKGNKPGKAIVFAVDEGILQVAKYNTPDPLSYFFRKRALEVQTAQILDLILPEDAIVRMLSAPGGDEFDERGIGKNLNPFKRKRDKPVVYWSGLIEIDSATRELAYRVPDYFNGTLRIMAVAVTPDSLGASQKKTPVRGHFVLSPNVPTFVAPNDEFTVTVSVANNVEGSGKNAEIRLDLATSEHVEVLDKTSRTLKINEGREESASFAIRAKKLGSARFSFTASLADKKSSYAAEASVRPAVPYMTDIKSGSFKKDKADVEVIRSMYPDFRTLEVSASPVPLGLAHGLAAYLSKFPYLCTEQLVSQTFPAVVLKNRPEFGYTHKNATANIDRTITVLRARQNAEGAFGFWAANSHTSDYATVYALHFLTEARERGFTVPQEPMTLGRVFLKRLAQAETDTLSKARTRAYAIYILTRNGIVTTNYVDAVREQLDKTKATKGWKKDITGAYLAACYKLLKLDNKADDLISKSSLGEEVEPDYEHFYDGLAHDSQYLYILAKHFPERFKKLSKEDMLCIDCMVKWISQGSFNSLSSAYTILAMDAYAEAVGEKAVADIRIKEVLENSSKDLAVPKRLFPKVAFSGDAKKVRVESKSGYPTFYQVTMAGFDNTLPQKEIREQIEVQREYRDLKGNVITSTILGSEIEVHVKMRSVKSGYHSNVAIVDLLPGGFEVVLEKSRPAAVPQVQQQEQPANKQPHEQEEGESSEEGEAETVSSDVRDETPTWVSPIGTDASTWKPDFVDIREDRVVLFGSIGDSAQEFVYRIKATNKGKFTVPPAFAESMYNRSVRARTLPGVMKVEERAKETHGKGK